MRRAAAALLCLLAGCQEQPRGQVVARVGGEEVTRRDLMIELEASGAAADVDLRQVQTELLDRVILRKLAAAEARHRAIDRTPEYLAAERRNRELLLAGQVADNIGRSLPIPTRAEIDRFVASNSDRFARRRLMLVDVIRTSAGGIDRPRLARCASNDEVARLLRAEGRIFERAREMRDSLAAAEDELEEPTRKPRIGAAAGMLSIEMPVSSVPAPVSGQERERLAEIILRRQASAKAFDHAVARLRARTRIEYQPGFAP